MVLLVAILAPPGQYGRDLAAQESGAFRWGKGAGEAGKRLALGVLDPPAVAVAEKMDEVTRARGGDGGQRRITWPQTPQGQSRGS